MLLERVYPKAQNHRERREARQKVHPEPIDMNRVASIILGGGQGTRLFPLTVTRCKPAISFGGRYRLIDVPISNSINSGCHKIYIVTQFLSSSLHQHIFKTYHRDTFTPGFVEVLPAEQKPNINQWFQGTGDAVRQNLDYLLETPVDYFLILSGDQLYNMDFRDMLRFAKYTNANLVVASLPVPEIDAKRMGLLKFDENFFITDFVEKPRDSKTLDKLRMSDSLIEQMDFVPEEGCHYLGSMGIYLFKRDALIDLLSHDTREDFGKHLIPTQVKHGGAAAYIHNGYWEDIGTIESYYKANMALTRPDSKFNIYDEANPIFSCRYNLPGPKIYQTQVSNSIICEGAIVEGDEVSNSILGPRAMIKKGTIIRDSYVLGNEYYAPPIPSSKLPVNLHIGEDCIIKNAIVDKHVYMGKGVQLINKNKLDHYNGENIFIRDGIIVVPRGSSLPDGFIL